MPEPIRITLEGLDGKLRISPPLFIENKTHVDPSDLSKFAPHGNGVYGYQEGSPNPLKIAPPQGDKGGYPHFGNNVSKEDFAAFMAITGVQEHWVVSPQKYYAVFYEESDNPMEDGCLAQMRLVDRRALTGMFGAIEESEYDSYPEQELTMSEAL
ncbi:MAG: hypothetical protein JKX80_01635 [Candidatus Pacebacteria bacterium]|nr:hypothetical protein [Candidatus Paceibacterota bacterium]